MNKQTSTPAEHARLLEKLERLEKSALSQQMEACARNCQALEDRVRELEAELESCRANYAALYESF